MPAVPELVCYCKLLRETDVFLPLLLVGVMFDAVFRIPVLFYEMEDCLRFPHEAPPPVACGKESWDFFMLLMFVLDSEWKGIRGNSICGAGLLTTFCCVALLVWLEDLLAILDVWFYT